MARHALAIHHLLCRSPSLSRTMRSRFGNISYWIVGVVVAIRVRVQKVLLCHLPPSPSRARRHERGKRLAERTSMRPTWCRTWQDGHIVIDGKRRASIQINCTIRRACMTWIMGARRRRAWENARRPRWHMDALNNAGE
jgi:hypothetical protein